MPNVEKQRERLIKLLKELFQLDQPDLDFGFYRIMHAKAGQVTTFLEEDLLGIIREAFGEVDESRIAIHGLGDGASVATIAASIDSHVNAAVLAFAQPMDIDELDARTFANAIAPRPILAIEAANGPSIFDACAEPKVRHNATGAGPALDDESEKVALDFFRQHVARS